MMQAPVDDVVDVIAVRNRLMATPRTMNMPVTMRRVVHTRTPFRVLLIDRQNMLLNAPIRILMMQMPVVKVVHVVPVFHRSVSTSLTMLMRVIAMTI